jgi:hypothetical protein
MAKAAWTTTYSLDRDEYTPLQNGMATVNLSNKTANQLLATRVALTFDWMGDTYFYKDCNMELAPGQTRELPSVPFHIELQAPLGAAHYKVGVRYRELNKIWVG